VDVRVKDAIKASSYGGAQGSRLAPVAARLDASLSVYRAVYQTVLCRASHNRLWPRASFHGRLQNTPT